MEFKNYGLSRETPWTCKSWEKGLLPTSDLIFRVFQEGHLNIPRNQSLPSTGQVTLRNMFIVHKPPTVQRTNLSLLCFNSTSPSTKVCSLRLGLSCEDDIWIDNVQLKKFFQLLWFYCFNISWIELCLRKSKSRVWLQFNNNFHRVWRFIRF